MRVAFLTVAILVLSLLATAREAAAAYTQATFQIGGIVTDIPADTTVLARIGDAGIDWVFWYGWHYASLRGAAEVTAQLEALRARRAGFAVKALACYKTDGGDPPRLGRGRLFLNRDPSPSRAAIDSTLSAASGIDGPSTLGYAIWDEPDPNDARAFTNIGLISSWIAAHPDAANKLAFTNLFSSIVGSTPLSDSSYAAYLKRYLDLFDSAAAPAPLLSFDEYPFQVPTRIEPNWFRTLRLVRDATNAYGRTGRRLPWQAMIELSPFHDPADTAFSPMFSVVHTRWQAYTAVAYGAKGLCYYQLGPASSATEVWGAGILGANGDTVATRYSQIRALDSDLHHLGPWLMRLDPVTTFHRDTLDWVGIKDELFTGPGHGMLSSFGAGADSTLAGHLKDRTNGDDYLMVVSKALIAKRTFTLTLATAADSLFRIDRATGKQVLLGTGTRSIRVTDLPPGQGELFRIVD